MTLDKLILGVTEGDVTVLDYLDSLSQPALEELFAPMFNVTRPAKRLGESQATPKATPQQQRSIKSKPLSRAAALLANPNLTAEQRALLEEFKMDDL